MATRSLSPKRAAERLQRFRSAVMTIAHYRAKQAVQAQIKARGERIADYSCRDISIMANVHLAQHQEELITKATAVVATFSEFSRYGCAKISNSVQTQSPPKSTTSAVQNSSANWRANR